MLFLPLYELPVMPLAVAGLVCSFFMLTASTLFGLRQFAPVQCIASLVLLPMTHLEFRSEVNHEETRVTEYCGESYMIQTSTILD